MMKTLLVAATMATLITGNVSRSQAGEKFTLKGVQLEVSDKTAASLLCRAEWKKQTDPQVLDYGSQYFVKICKRKVLGTEVAATPRR